MPARRTRKTQPVDGVDQEPPQHEAATPLRPADSVVAFSPPRASSSPRSLHYSLSELGNLLGLPLTDDSHYDRQAFEYAEKADLSAFLRSLPPDDYDCVLARVVEVSKQHLRPESFQLRESASPTRDASLHTLWAVASLILCFMEITDKYGVLLFTSIHHLPPAFMEAARLCRDVLLHIPDSPHQQNLAAEVLEQICAEDIEGCEQLYGALLSFLLDRCSSPRVTSADIARLYKLRKLLPEMHWEAESNESVKVRMLHCVANPQFAVKRHGSDLIAMFYILSARFTSDVNGAIKNQVAQGRSVVSLKAYAMSLWKALHLGRDEVLAQLEKCVQDWIVLALRTSRRSAEKARAVLDEIHRHHLEPLERELLCKCYGPVLWRSLKVANWQVRENATKIISLIFPLIPPESAVEAEELETMKQIRNLQETLEDTNEHVRRAGIISACLIIKDYWDYIPNQACAQLLATMKDKCSRDKKAPSVRAAIAEGFVHILENPCSHPAMEAILQEIGPKFLHDRSPLVRSAFASLLNTIALCRGISMESVISHEDILLALCSEHAQSLLEKQERTLWRKGALPHSEIHTSTKIVAEKLTELTASSLFTGGLADQVGCCYELLRQYPLPLLSLIGNAGEFVPLLDRFKLAVALFHEGRKEVQRALDGRSEDIRKPALVTVLRVAGALLEGAQCTMEKKGRQSETSNTKIAPELEKFVYAHIKDEDLLPLLRSQKQGASLDALWADLMFALSPLDPRQLPRLAEFVRRKVQAICKGECQLPPTVRLCALLHVAASWDILCNAVQPVWQYLLDSPEDFSAGEIEEEGLEQALRVADIIFRDSVLRGVMLQSKATTLELKQIVSRFVCAFTETLSQGLEQVSNTRKGSEKALLGPMAQTWPKVLGLVFRIANHLEFRVPTATSEARTSSSLDVLASHGPLEETRSRISSFFQGEQFMNYLGQLESSVVTCSNGSPLRKKPRVSRSTTLPSDIDLVLQIQERLLEFINVSGSLAPLMDSGEQREDDNMLSTNLENLTRVQELDDLFWRWVSVADKLQPSEGISRRANAWVTSAHIFQQLVRRKFSTTQVISIASKLFGRITDDIPGEDADVKNLLNPLLWQFELKDDHEFCSFLRRLLGDAGNLTESTESQPLQVHDRLRNCIKEALNTKFSRLRTKLMQDAGSDLGLKDNAISKAISALTTGHARELPSPCRSLLRA